MIEFLNRPTREECAEILQFANSSQVLKRFAAACLALLDECDSLRNDLNWLEQNHIEQSNPPQSPGLYEGLSQYKKIGINCRPGLTLRQAIDAARESK